MKPYDIAHYLSDEDKRRILAHRFIFSGQATGGTLGGEDVIYRGLVPVSADDQCCPLAYVEGIDRNFSAPDSDTVARAIFRRLDEVDHDAQCPSELDTQGYCECTSRLPDAIEAAAAAFIEDWGKGRIPPKQLSRVLGAS